MKQLDLGPDDYRKQTPDGRWRVPDKPIVNAVGFFFALAMLGIAFWWRNDVTVETLFAFVAIIAAAGGINLAIWLKDEP